MSNACFEGYYFKHQKDNNTIALIPGISGNNAFIQVITNDNSYYFSYPKSEYENGKAISIGNCKFSKMGIIIDIQKNGTVIKGRVRYTGLKPLKYDIMGPFKYFPMECRHGIISMSHNLNGWININGRSIDLNGGIGYIETDSGTSFPKTYTWIQCNDFKENCSVSVSVAEIPFMGLHFTGCICAVYYNDKEYRLATYLGAVIIHCDREKIVIKQGKYLLVINISGHGGQSLLAPQCGKMNRTITECASCNAEFSFYENGKLLFNCKSRGACFECVS